MSTQRYMCHGIKETAIGIKSQPPLYQSYQIHLFSSFKPYFLICVVGMMPSRILVRINEADVRKTRGAVGVQ